MSYATWKKSVLGKIIGDGQCVALVVNNNDSYTHNLWPKVSWTSIIKPVPSAKDVFNSASSKYFTKIKNDHSNVSQLPKQGDILVFDATPKAGYTNKFNNPWGHIGICDRADSKGIFLLQQNAPISSEVKGKGSPVNVHYYSWRYRPCIGWLRPIKSKPAPDPDKAKIADLQSQLKQQTADVKSLKQQLKDSQALSSSLKSQNGGLTTKVIDLTDENKQISEELDTCTTDSKKKSKTITDLAKKNSNLQSSITATNRDSNQLNAFGKLLKWFLVRLGISKGVNNE